jgi:hypothetical protein
MKIIKTAKRGKSYQDYVKQNMASKTTLIILTERQKYIYRIVSWTLSSEVDVIRWTEKLKLFRRKKIAVAVGLSSLVQSDT